MLMPAIVRSLLDDDRFQKQCLSQIARQFDINQVFDSSFIRYCLVQALALNSKLSTFGYKKVALKMEIWTVLYSPKPLLDFQYHKS